VRAVEETQRTHAGQLEGRGSLGSLLIQPVQRIPRYRMLLEELLRQCHLRVISIPTGINPDLTENCLGF
jgi:hypothetical protein